MAHESRRSRSSTRLQPSVSKLCRKLRWRGDSQLRMVVRKGFVQSHVQRQTLVLKSKCPFVCQCATLSVSILPKERHPFIFTLEVGWKTLKMRLAMPLPLLMFFCFLASFGRWGWQGEGNKGGDRVGRTVFRNSSLGTSLVSQWLRIHLRIQGHRFDPWSGKIPHAAEQLSWCTTTTKPAHYNY